MYFRAIDICCEYLPVVFFVFVFKKKMSVFSVARSALEIRCYHYHISIHVHSSIHVLYRLKSNVALACLVLKSQGKDCVEWQGGLTSRKVAKTLLKHLLLALDDKKHQSHGCSALAIERGM